MSRPVTSFLAIAFGISWLVGIPFNIATSSVFDPSTLQAIYVPRLVTVLGPAIAALIVARSRADLLRSLIIPVRCLAWVPAIVAVGVIMAVAAFALAGVPVMSLFEVFRHAVLLFAVHLLIQVLIVGVGEELGWRGWLLPRLADGRTFASATALTGLAWTLWHLPVFIFNIQMALAFIFLLIALTVIQSWLWIRAQGSVGIAAVAHGAVNAPFFFLESSVRAELTTKAFGYLSLLYASVAIALAIGARRVWLSRPT